MEQYISEEPLSSSTIDWYMKSMLAESDINSERFLDWINLHNKLLESGFTQAGFSNTKEEADQIIDELRVKGINDIESFSMPISANDNEYLYYVYYKK